MGPDARTVLLFLRVAMANETVKLNKSKAEWQQQLSPMEYSVTREKGTERAFSGRYWDHNEEGIYRCVCCATPLFASDTKFDSGCGWPSYFKALDPANVREERDISHGMTRRRTEATLSTADARSGHAVALRQAVKT